MFVSQMSMANIDTPVGSFGTHKHILSQLLIEGRSSFIWKYEQSARIEVGLIETQLDHVNVSFPEYAIVMRIREKSQSIAYKDWKLQFEHNTNQIAISYSKPI